MPVEIKKEDLDKYRSKKEEISELKYLLAHLDDGDRMIDNDTILDYSTGYPRPQSIVGYDFEKSRRQQERYKKRINSLQEECLDVELWIEDIPDSLTRRIFRMYYVNGMTQEQIAKRIHMTQAAVSKKINGFFKME